MRVALPCKFCGKPQIVELTIEQIRELQSEDRRLVQEIIPEIPAEQRELFISGMCGKCWNELWK